MNGEDREQKHDGEKSFAIGLYVCLKCGFWIINDFKSHIFPTLYAHNPMSNNLLTRVCAFFARLKVTCKHVTC